MLTYMFVVSLLIFSLIPSALGVQMLAVDLYSGTSCQGNVINGNGRYVGIAQGCTAIVSTADAQQYGIAAQSYSWSCSSYNYYLGSGTCSGNATFSTSANVGASACVPTLALQSYRVQCREVSNVVQVNFRFGNCTSRATYSVYIQTGVCQPISSLQSYAGVVFTVSAADQSYMISTTISGSFTVTRYDTIDCTGTSKVFNNVSPGTCSEATGDSGNGISSAQAVTIVNVNDGSLSFKLHSLVALGCIMMTTLLF
jgi:hypothetical protein